MKKYKLILGLAFILSGCLAPEIKEEPIKTIITKENNKNSQFILKEKKWWSYAENKNFNLLVEEILNKNEKLKISKLNIDKSLASLKATSFANLSPIGIGGGYNWAYMTDPKLKLNGFPMGEINDPERLDIGKVGIQAEYIFDIWGKFSALKKSAKFANIGAVLQNDWSRFNISILVAELYGKYVYLINEKKLISNQLNIANEILTMQEIMVKNGLGKDEDILNAKNNINRIKQFLNSLDVEIKSIKNSFYYLAGDISSKKIDELLANSLEEKKQFIDFIAIPEYIDSDVIAKRLDIQYYLTVINSQRERLKSLKADFYPRISIVGDYNFSHFDLKDLFKMSSNFWTFGPNLYLPIFNRNRIVQNYKIAGVDLNIFITNYNDTVLKAYTDINNSLNLLKITQKNNDLERDRYFNIKKEYKDKKLLFSLGKISNLQLLLEKNNMINEELEMLKQNYLLYQNKLKLISNIGGYYKNEVKNNGK